MNMTTSLAARRPGSFTKRSQPVPFGCFPLLLLMLAITAPLANSAETRPAVQKTILLGMSTALSGPAAQLGVSVRTGVQAALQEANSAGGVNSHLFELIALDDGYEPDRTGPNIKRLIREHKVFSLIGNVGTPTAVVTAPLANQLKTPFFGAYTGAGILRKVPPDRYIFNYRASYAEETAAMVDALIDIAGIKVSEIAFFTQRDAYGDAGFAGGLAALINHGMSPESRVVHGRYERNTTQVEYGLSEIILSLPPPKAIILVGAYSPCAAFIRQARKIGLDAIFLNVSFVGAEPLRRELGQDGDGVIITQVVPHFESHLAIVRDYRTALSHFHPDAPLSFASLEGYIAARLFLHGIAKTGYPPTKERLIDTLESLDSFEFGLDRQLCFSKEDHQASHTVWPTVIRNNKVVPFDWQELKTSGGKNL